MRPRIYLSEERYREILEMIRSNRVAFLHSRAEAEAFCEQYSKLNPKEIPEILSPIDGQYRVVIHTISSSS